MGARTHTRPVDQKQQDALLPTIWEQRQRTSEAKEDPSELPAPGSQQLPSRSFTRGCPGSTLTGWICLLNSHSLGLCKILQQLFSPANAIESGNCTFFYLF